MSDRGARRLAWVMLCFWAAALVALQSWVAEQPALARWTPELGLVLLVALAGQRHFASLLWASFWLATTRLAFSIELPSAVLAGYLGVALLLRALCSVFELRGFLARALVSGSAAWLFLEWLAFVHSWHAGLSALPPSVAVAANPIATSALASALCGVALGPLLRRLPGSSPLVAAGLGGAPPVRFAARAAPISTPSWRKE